MALKDDQRRVLRDLASDCDDLIEELREARATAPDKATIRAVLLQLEKARNAFDKAIGRAAQ